MIKFSTKNTALNLSILATLTLLIVVLMSSRASSVHNFGAVTHFSTANCVANQFQSTPSSSPLNGYHYRTIQYLVVSGDQNLLGHEMSGVCDAAPHLSWMGLEADTVTLGYESEFVQTLSTNPSPTAGAVKPIWGVAAPGAVDRSNNLHAANVDDAGAMTLDDSTTVWCNGMGSPITLNPTPYTNCDNPSLNGVRTDVFSAPPAFPSVQYSEAGGAPPLNPHAYTGGGFLYTENNGPSGCENVTSYSSIPSDPGALPLRTNFDCNSAWFNWYTRYGIPQNGDLTAKIGAPGGEVRDFRFRLHSKNTWPSGWSVGVRLTYRYPVDVCPNISGNQITVPTGYEVNGSGDCVLPAADTPTCNIYSQAFTIGSNNTYQLRINNRADVNITVNRVRFTGFGTTANATPSGENNINATSVRNYNTTSIGPTADGVITARIRYRTALLPGYVETASINCVNVTAAPIPDVCPNIPGNQAVVPAGYTIDGFGNCVIPAADTPACNIYTQGYPIGSDNSYQLRINNRASVIITVDRVRFTGLGETLADASPGGENDIGISAVRNYDTGTIGPTATGVITARISYRTALISSYTETADVTCVNVTATVDPVTCTVSTTVPGNPDIGRLFGVIVSVFNPNAGIDADITLAEYSVTGGSVSIGGSGGAIESVPHTLGTSSPGNSTTFSSNSDISVGSTGLFNIEWTITNSLGSPVTCDSDFETIILPPTCTASVNSYFTGSSVTVEVSLTIYNSNFVTIPGGVDLEFEVRETLGDLVFGPVTLIPGQPVDPPAANFTASVTSPLPPGVYDVIWTMASAFGSCADTDADSLIGTLTISDVPYARFYGNDIYAGGGVGEGCSTATVGVDGFVNRSGGGLGEYQGTAVQLAIFASGVINGVQPNAMRITQNPRVLAFSNSSGANPVFGGGFNTIACSHDYYADANSTGTANVNLHSRPTGSYTYGPGSLTTMNTGPGIQNGRNVTVYVDGDVRIEGSPARPTHFGYASTGGWTSTTNIPSLYIITNGSIFIDSEVTTMDGVFIAQEPGQAIYTCAGGTLPSSEELDLTTAATTPGSVDSLFLINNCESNLTVNGAFLSNQVHLLRTLGHILNGSAGEGPNNLLQAETFIYSPELYINTAPSLTQTGYSQGIDSIISLPPTF